MTQTALFAQASAEAVEYHGHRTTPPDVVGVLCSLPEFVARPGITLDLGCGEGGLCREIERRQPGQVNFWGLVDARQEALDAMSGWLMAWNELYCFDASCPWPPGHDGNTMDWAKAERIVTNPPWSVSVCPECRAQWLSKIRTSCKKCEVRGLDLAIEMVKQAMAHCQNADIWAIHNAHWPFHGERGKFFDRPPESHRFAGTDFITWRSAWGDPAERKAVKGYNKPVVIYHWTPAARFTGQHARYHTRETP